MAPPNLVSLEDGAISAGAPPSAVPPPTPAVPLPTRTTSAPLPSPGPAAVVNVPAPRAETQFKPSFDPAPTFSPVVETKTPVRSSEVRLHLSTDSGENSRISLKDESADTALREENAKLVAELRESREKIRNLELQVETLKANAQKAAALLG